MPTKVSEELPWYKRPLDVRTGGRFPVLISPDKERFISMKKSLAIILTTALLSGCAGATDKFGFQTQAFDYSQKPITIPTRDIRGDLNYVQLYCAKHNGFWDENNTGCTISPKNYSSCVRIYPNTDARFPDDYIQAILRQLNAQCQGTNLKVID